MGSLQVGDVKQDADEMADDASSEAGLLARVSADPAAAVAVMLAYEADIERLRAALDRLSKAASRTLNSVLRHPARDQIDSDGPIGALAQVGRAQEGEDG